MGSEREDRELLRRWNAGEAEAFGLLFERVASRLYSLAFRLTGSREDARDLLQTAALRALSSPHKCSQEGKFLSWMRRIVTNLFLDRLRADQRHGKTESVDEEVLDRIGKPEVMQGDGISPRLEMQEAQLQTEIERALSRLSPPYRTAIILRDIEGLSYAEIADLENLPIETVRTRLRRAREQVREMLRGLTD